MAHIEGIVGREGRVAKHARWRGHVDAWVQSGLSAAQYCRREGLRANSFYRWRSVFRDEGEGTGNWGFMPPSEPNEPLFAQVELTQALGSVEAFSLEVVLAQGHRVRVAADFDEEALQRLVKALEGLSC